MSESNQNDAASAALVKELVDGGKHLSKNLRETIFANKAEMVQPLIDVLDDPELALEKSPGNGWAPIHAVDLLIDMGATEAIEPMLAVLAETDWMDILHDRLIGRLGELGAPVLEPALQLYADTEGDDEDEDARHSIIGVLSSLKVKDDRVFDILMKDLADRPDYAGNIAEYGDPRALPHLARALDAYEVVEKSPFANQTAIELLAAIEELGGTLTEAQRRKADRVDELVSRYRKNLNVAIAAPRIAPTRSRKVGRNEPCPCGSGKKYKKCHETEDEGRVSVRH